MSTSPSDLFTYASTSTSSAEAVVSNGADNQAAKDGQSQSRSANAATRAADAASEQDILLFLVAFRILNALIVTTFFQPDEYFQSLEPAWRMVFGPESGAWITWEWRNALRSAIHPTIFATVYYVAHLVAQVLDLAPATRAQLLLTAPKMLQGAFAALGDYYTWRLAERVFGHQSRQPWAALALTVCSPWQWFCSTRTLSNCLETTLTVAALYNWPWQWSLADREDAKYDGAGLRMREDAGMEPVDEKTGLRRSLLLAALATILRPTNALIWVTLAAMTCLKMSNRGWFAQIPGTGQRVLMELTSPSFLRATRRERTELITQSVLCGSAVLILSLLVDRSYYQFWTFPPLKFVFFNVIQSLSVFYGRNDWHYYLSQGFPLLLTTALPFAMAGIYQGFFSANLAHSPLTRTILSQLATITCVMPAALSLISHKEVRFIYPLLPLLHLLAAEPLTQLFVPSITHSLRSCRTPRRSLLKRLLLGLILLLNIALSIYITIVHNRGVLDVLTYLRHQHETYYLPHQNLDHQPNAEADANLTAAFLTPCHSTPWRSHLIHSSISAWALTCEPPLHLPPSARETYMDEADAFFADPSVWVLQNMNRSPPRAGFSHSRRRDRDKGGLNRRKRLDWGGERYDWPDYLVFFEQAEKVMDTVLSGSGYAECWRGFNSHWHDDWRRRGDVVVWCLFPDRKIREEEEMAARRRQKVMIWLNAVERVKGVIGRWTNGSWWWSSNRQRHGKDADGKVHAISRHHGHGDSVLAGANGPWGIGRSRRQSKDSEKTWWNLPWRAKAQQQQKKKKKKKRQQGTWS